MAQQSYYDILGVQKSATPEEIKKAFRKKAQTTHPDAGGSEEEFKKINEAYEVLSDPEKRKEYDAYGQYMGSVPPQGRGQWGGAQGWPGGTTIHWTNVGGSGKTSGFSSFSDIFDRISRGEGAWGTDWEMPKQPSRGRDLQASLNLSFAEAFNGTTKKITIRLPQTGESQTITVRVPAGATDGGKLRYRGKGDVGIDGGQRGDLIIVTKIAPDPIFTRQDADVLLDLTVTYPEAVLGTTVTVPTPDGGRARLRIPAGTKDGAVLRMSDKGAPKLKGSGRGALKIRIRIAVPSKLTEQQRNLVSQLRETMDPDAVRPQIANATHVRGGKA